MTSPSPFGVLDLPASAELTDDDVRAAWRRVAAATHPDRSDGGDPASFAAAAAAYALLRTQAGRAEALADVRAQASGPRAGGRVPSPLLRVPARAFAARRIARGRPWRLALRVLATAAASCLAVAAVGWQPASAAVMAGALTWLVCTGRADLGA
jgi:curved DNA-binding protein CbpA